VNGTSGGPLGSRSRFDKVRFRVTDIDCSGLSRELDRIGVWPVELSEYSPLFKSYSRILSNDAHKTVELFGMTRML